ncbi:MAG TPA: DinB family protein [Holophagaceae bacterium]|nr:DinB family protein [Holophagaceae bacterium]
MIEDLQRLFRRDLETLVREIELYPDDARLWAEVPGQPTSGGNLALHLVGNLRHFIGATLGGTGFVRHREAEFASKGLSRAALVAEIRSAAAEVEAALAALDPDRLDQPFPLEMGGGQLTTRRMLLHLATHLGFHMGQLDYHRRAATGDRVSAAPMGFKGLVP